MYFRLETISASNVLYAASSTKKKKLRMTPSRARLRIRTPFTLLLITISLIVSSHTNVQYGIFSITYSIV